MKTISTRPGIPPRVCCGRVHGPGARNAFTLVEVIVSLLLVGILGTFTLFFLADGIEGYFTSQKAAESAFKAQMALNRVRVELLSIDVLLADPVLDTSIRYQSTDEELAGSRALKFSNGVLYLTVDGTDYPLIDEVSNPILEVQYEDLDNDSLIDEVAYVDVGFTLESQPAYSVRVYPRNMVAKFS
jgi:prepilin-type N-terminal cleavage/methylation domain-containing protein